MDPVLRRRVAIGVVVGALLLGAAVMGSGRDTGPSLVPAMPPPVEVLPDPPAPEAPAQETPPFVMDDEMAPPEALPGQLPAAARLDAPGSPIDPDQTFTSDLRGVVAAAVSRQERFVDCFDQVRLRDPEDAGYTRYTLEIELAPDGVADARVVTGPDDLETQNCVGEAMRDARFEPVGEPQRVTWSVPLPEPVAEPDDEGPEGVEADLDRETEGDAP